MNNHHHPVLISSQLKLWGVKFPLFLSLSISASRNVFCCGSHNVSVCGVLEQSPCCLSESSLMNAQYHLPPLVPPLLSCFPGVYILPCTLYSLHCSIHSDFVVLVILYTVSFTVYEHLTRTFIQVWLPLISEPPA